MEPNIDDMCQLVEELNNRLKGDETGKPNLVFNEEGDDINTDIERAEGMYDELIEYRERKVGIIEKLEEMKEKIDEYIQTRQKTIEEVEESINTILEQLINLENRKPYPNVKNKLEYESKKLDVSKHKEQVEHNLLTKEESDKIKEWSSFDCGAVVFDTDNDNWSVNNSVFRERIIGKNKLLVVIKDTNGNKFGGFVCTDVNDDQTYTHDPSSFIFNLKVNGTSQMDKFNVLDQPNVCDGHNSFRTYPDDDIVLFSFGRKVDYIHHDICVFKQGSGKDGYHSEDSFNYSNGRYLFGAQGERTFVPERVVMIQMV